MWCNIAIILKLHTLSNAHSGWKTDGKKLFTGDADAETYSNLNTLLSVGGLLSSNHKELNILYPEISTLSFMKNQKKV